MTNQLIDKVRSFTLTQSRFLSAFGLAICLSLIAGPGMAGNVYVPAPSGDATTDWNNIQAAIDSADVGDKVKFAAGTYLLGEQSEFIVVGTPRLRLIGSKLGTTIIGGEVLPTVGQTASPYLMGDGSLLESPPRGFHLRADQLSVRNIRFEGFRTAIIIGFGEFTGSGGYEVADCEFADSLYGIQAHVESTDVSVIRGNSFINLLYGYFITGGRFEVVYNYSATPEPDKVPIDGFTHSAGSLIAGDFVFTEGQAAVSSRNLFEHNIVEDGIGDGIQIVAGPGGVVTGNFIRNNEFHDMTNYGTMAIFLSIGGDVVDNAILNNTVDGSWDDGFLALNYGGSIDGNVLVGNEFTLMKGGYGDAMYIAGATDTILLDNVITGVTPGDVTFGAFIGWGSSNKFLLNHTDAEFDAIFYYSPDGVFAPDDPAGVAVDENLNPVQALDPNQDYSRLLRCVKHLKDKHLKDTESVADFKECVADVLVELN